MEIWDRVVELVRVVWLQLRQGRLTPMSYWVYPVVALLTAIEGPFATLVAAAASAAGLARPGWVFVSAATGNLAADTLWYTLGRAGRLEWVTRAGGRFGLRQRHMNDLRYSMQRHAPRVLFFAKLTEGLAIPALVVAGLSRVRWRRWLLPIAAAELIWTGSLVLIGYHAAETIRQVDSAVQFFALGAAGVAALVGLWWVRRRWLGRETGHAPVSDTHTE